SKVLGKTPWGAIGAKAFDFNNDGRLDLLIVDMHSDMWVPADPNPNVRTRVAQYERRKFQGLAGPFSDKPAIAAIAERLGDIFRVNYEEVVFGNTLFKNLGQGKFVEVSAQAGMETLWPWGIATGDFNNDGFVDVFLPSGMGFPFFYWPNRLMMNNGDETFSERSEAEGIEPPSRGLYLDKDIAGEKAA